jgi:hypothetical protein
MLWVSTLPNRARVSVDGHIVYDGQDLQAARRIKDAWMELSRTDAKVRWKVPPWNGR